MSVLKNTLSLALIILITGTFAFAQQKRLKNMNVLVYTKNGEGYVHDNIPNAVLALEKLGQQHQFNVDVSDDPAVFTQENLKQYTMLIFPSTNNDVFNTDDQRLAFRRYMQAGGGFVGIHSVTGTERNWTWFKQMIGGTFSWHAPNQTFDVQIIRPAHPSMKGLPKVWERKDEMYFTKEMYPGIKVLAAHVVSSLDDRDADKVNEFSKHFGNLYPSVWYQHFDGGNVWLTTLGHDKESYQDPVFIQHLLQGIEHVAGQSKPLDFRKAYAQSRDDAVRY